MPIVWRDAWKHDFVHHLIGSFNWGPLDFLIVDMPPGTGNELITLCDMLEGANVSSVLVPLPGGGALAACDFGTVLRDSPAALTAFAPRVSVGAVPSSWSAMPGGTDRLFQGIWTDPQGDTFRA